MTVTAEDILTEAIRGWEGGAKWHQGSGHGPNGETCLVVGINDAREHLTKNILHYHSETYVAWAKATRAVFRLIGGNPVQWNDDRSRTYEDVLLVVEQARANLKGNK